jgi:hypothetical protein
VISGATADANCQLFFAGAEWGTLIRLRTDGTIDRETGRIPGWREGVKLERGFGPLIVAWSRRPEFLSFVNVKTWSVDSIPLHRTPWGNVGIGPVTTYSDSLLLIVPVAGAAPQPRPTSAVAAPLVERMNRRGSSESVVGPIPERPGRYLPWLAARSIIGTLGDTLLLVSVADARVTAFALNDSHLPLRMLWSKQLPHYIRSPEPYEEIWSPDWIQIGGEIPSLIHVPQVGAAAVGPDGRLYAIRTYLAEWRRVTNRYVPTQGAWFVTKSGLEVYSRRGELERAFVLPDDAKEWIRVTEGGRILLGGANRIYVVRTEPESGACPRLPSSIDIDVVDEPPAVVRKSSMEGGS